MKVYGHHISNEDIDLVFTHVTSQTNFTARQVVNRLAIQGVHRDARYRAADRAIQKWKKEGKIFYDKGNQCWRDIKYYDAIYG